MRLRPLIPLLCAALAGPVHAQAPTTPPETLSVSQSQLEQAGERIFHNETGGKEAYLVHWNQGEEFASLGIGHFIWYPEHFDGPFDEIFPKLVAYYRQQGIALPALFEQHPDCPWNSLAEFEASKDSAEVREAIRFLADTKGVQTAFIFERLEQALARMEAVSGQPDHIRQQFYLVANSPGGIYPLIDYVNFKGEGIQARERYKGQGWGMMQILEAMDATHPGPEAVAQFAHHAGQVLERRVANAPSERGEERWLPGWLKRVNSYLQP